MNRFRVLTIASVLFFVIFGFSLVQALATPVLSTEGMTIAPMLTTVDNPANYVITPRAITME